MKDIPKDKNVIEILKTPLHEDIQLLKIILKQKYVISYKSVSND